MNKKIRCAAYVRVSTDEQVATWGSLEWQQDRILKAISVFDNYIIDKKNHIFIDDGYSWASDSRPAFDKMMNSAKNWEFDILFVYAIDRLYRKTLGLLEAVERLDKYWVKFKSATQDIDTSSSFWKSILQIMWAIAELERNLIRERTIMWKLTKVKKGYFVWWWKSPLWYEYVSDWIWKKAKIIENEAKIIRKIFDLYTNENKSLWEIKKILEIEWLKTKDDTFYDWKTSWFKNIVWTWHTTTISRILQNEMYTGIYYYGRIEKVNWKKNLAPKENWIAFECPAILKDKSIFYKAQELLKKNKLTKNNENPHMFAGLIKCWECWKNYVGSIAKKNWKEYVNYKCKWSVRSNYIEDNRCSNSAVSELFLFNKCWKKIDEIIRNPKKLLEEYYKDDKTTKSLNEFYDKISDIDKTIIKNNNTIQNLYEAIYSTNDKNDITNKEAVVNKLKNQIEWLNSLKIEIEEKIKKLKNIDNSKNNLMQIIKIYKNKLDNLKEEKKVELLHLFIEKIILFENNSIKVHLKFENTEKDKNNATPETSIAKKKVINKNGVSSVTID